MGTDQDWPVRPKDLLEWLRLGAVEVLTGLGSMRREINSDFEVQRSVDGLSFMLIGQVKVPTIAKRFVHTLSLMKKLVRSTKRHYTTDYVRSTLMALSLFTYGSVEQLLLTARHMLNVYPNPASEQFTVFTHYHATRKGR